MVLKVVHRVATWAVLAIGVIHTVGTWFFFDGLSEAAIWFAGAGLAGIAVPFLNMALWGERVDGRQRRLTDVANVLFLGWLAAGVVATPALPSFVVATMGGTMAMSGLALSRRPDHRSQINP